MDATVGLFLMVLGLVLLLLASANVSHPRISFGWLGLFFVFVGQMVK